MFYLTDFTDFCKCYYSKFDAATSFKQVGTEAKKDWESC